MHGVSVLLLRRALLPRLLILEAGSNTVNSVLTVHVNAAGEALGMLRARFGLSAAPVARRDDVGMGGWEATPLASADAQHVRELVLPTLVHALARSGMRTAAGCHLSSGLIALACELLAKLPRPNARVAASSSGKPAATAGAPLPLVTASSWERDWLEPMLQILFAVLISAAARAGAAEAKTPEQRQVWRNTETQLRTDDYLRGHFAQFGLAIQQAGMDVEPLGEDEWPRLPDSQTWADHKASLHRLLLQLPQLTALCSRVAPSPTQLLGVVVQSLRTICDVGVALQMALQSSPASGLHRLIQELYRECLSIYEKATSVRARQ